MSTLVTCIAYNPKGRFRAFYGENRSLRKAWLHYVSACSSHSIPWVDRMRTLGVAGPDVWEAISVLVHGTKEKNLMSVFAHGLVPRGVADNPHRLAFLSVCAVGQSPFHGRLPL